MVDILESKNNIAISDSDEFFAGRKKTRISISEKDQELIKNRVLEELKKELKTDKSSLMSIFGIFASIITFLSVEVQILQRASSFDQLIFLSLILFVSLSGFVFVLQWLIKNWIDDDTNKNPVHLYVFIIILFILILFFGIRSSNQDKFKNNDLYDLNIQI